MCASIYPMHHWFERRSLTHDILCFNARSLARGQSVWQRFKNAYRTARIEVNDRIRSTQYDGFQPGSRRLRWFDRRGGRFQVVRL